MKKKWGEWKTSVRLITVHAAYRSLTRPLFKLIDTIEAKAKENSHTVAYSAVYPEKKLTQCTA